MPFPFRPIRRLHHRAVAALIYLSLIPLRAAAPPDDAIGVWTFEPQKSTYESGPAPQRSTRVFERTGDGVHFLHTGLAHDGTPFRTEFIANYDGKEYPVSGSALYDTVALKRLDRATVQQMFRRQGAVTVTARRVVSDDRRRLTITAEGVNAEGRRFRNVLVYRRAE